MGTKRVTKEKQHRPQTLGAKHIIRQVIEMEAPIGQTKVTTDQTGGQIDLLEQPSGDISRTLPSKEPPDDTFTMPVV